MDDAKSDDILVSVIVPVYNVAKYLGRCLDSLLAQTHNNCEFIVIDDGSTDESARICDQYAVRDGRVKVVHKQNGGLSSARNVGLGRARGSYYVFVDSDDYVEPDYVESLLCAILRSDADLAMCSVICESKNGELSPLPYFAQLDDNVHTRHDCMAIADKNVSMIVAWNKLYRANLWSSLRFPEGEIHEDELTFHYLMEECKSIVFISKMLYHYVRNEESIMHSGYSLKNLTRVKALSERLAVLNRLGYEDLVPAAIDRLISEYLAYILHMDYHNFEVRKVLSAIGKQIGRDVRSIRSPLSFMQKLNLFGIIHYPILYLDVRQCVSSLRKR